MHETNVQVGQSEPAVGGLFQPVEEEMLAVRRTLAAELASDEGIVDTLCQYVARYQGKMLRPAILLLAGKLCGSLTPGHVTFATVIELVHLATLVHDDVLDEAHTRRRSATVSRLWGNEPSVLLGDLLLSKAFDLCNRARNPDAARELSLAANVVCKGELLQCLNRETWDMTEERYLHIIETKTASLYELCCRLGAQFSGASAADQAALEAYGRFVGCAFQITDDLLDITGREDETGKTLGTDLAQGKLTLPLIHFCRQASPESRQEFIALAKDNHPDAEFRDRLGRSGSLEYTKQRARDFIGRALDQLQTFKACPARQTLAEIAEFVVERSC